MQKYFCLIILGLSIVSCAETTYGITLRDKTEKFTVFKEGSAASNIKEEDDGSVSWVASAAGGGGGGASFYIKSSKEEINIANYESMDIELDYSTVDGKWDAGAKNPSFVIRILPYDSTGLFGGYEELAYIDGDGKSGTLKKNIKIPSDFAEKVVESCDFDSILAFGVKFNDYNRGNKDGDQLKVTLKTVKFNAKEDADEDKAFDDGLEDDQRGKVIEINYPTKDYTMTTNPAKYEKHAWVYLLAGYDESDKDTK